MVMALNGQRVSQRLQPVQGSAATSTANLVQRTVSNASTCSGQTAMQRPQPVQRAGSMSGSGARGGRPRGGRPCGAGAGGAESCEAGMGSI